MKKDTVFQDIFYPNPALIAQTAMVVDVDYTISRGELVQIPDFGEIVPPSLSFNNRNDEANDSVDDSNAIRLLETLKANGLSELESEKIRQKMQEGFSAVIDQVFAALSTDPSGAPAKAAAVPILNQEMDVRALMAASRRGESMHRNGRELAEEIVIGSLANWGNADWDPGDPQSSRTSENNFLLALLRY